MQSKRASNRDIHAAPEDVTIRYAVVFFVILVRFFFIPMSAFNVFRICFLLFLLLVDPRHSGGKGFVEGRILYALSIFFIMEPFHDEGNGSTPGQRS